MRVSRFLLLGISLLLWIYLFFQVYGLMSFGYYYTDTGLEPPLGAIVIDNIEGVPPGALLLLFQTILTFLLVRNPVRGDQKWGKWLKIRPAVIWWMLSWEILLVCNVGHLHDVFSLGFDTNLNSIRYGHYLQYFSATQIFLYYPTVYCIQKGGGWVFVFFLFGVLQPRICGLGCLHSEICDRAKGKSH